MNLQIIDKWIKDNFASKTNHKVNVGDTVKVVIRLNEQAKNKAQKTQIIHGLVIAKKHGSEIGSTITIRRIVSGIGIEWILPLNSPDIISLEVLKSSKVRKSKLYFLRDKTIKETKSKLRKSTTRVESNEDIFEEEAEPEIEEEIATTEETAESTQPVEEK